MGPADADPSFMPRFFASRRHHTRPVPGLTGFKELLFLFLFTI